jgi:hypothetical protein
MRSAARTKRETSRSAESLSGNNAVAIIPEMAVAETGAKHLEPAVLANRAVRRFGRAVEFFAQRAA